MTLDQLLLEKLIELVPIVAGALIALAGGGLKYWVDRADRRRQIRRDKLERLLQLAHDLKDWTDLIDNRYTFAKNQDHVPSPMEEMKVLGTLYFPDLGAEIDAVSLAAKRYKKLAIDLAGERQKAGGTAPTDLSRRAGDKYGELLDSIKKLTGKAEVVARELL